MRRFITTLLAGVLFAGLTAVPAPADDQVVLVRDHVVVGPAPDELGTRERLGGGWFLRRCLRRRRRSCRRGLGRPVVRRARVAAAGGEGSAGHKAHLFQFQ